MNICKKIEEVFMGTFKGIKVYGSEFGYECSICYDFFHIDDIAYSLWGHPCIYPHVCKECNIPIEKASKKRFEKRILNELGLKYHHNIGRIGNSYYEFVIYMDNKQELIKTGIDSIGRDTTTTKFNNLMRIISDHYKHDPLVSESTFPSPTTK